MTRFVDVLLYIGATVIAISGACMVTKFFITVIQALVGFYA